MGDGRADLSPWVTRRAADLARAVAESLSAPSATVWIGDAARLQPAGVHPGDGEPEATSLDEQRATARVIPVVRDGLQRLTRANVRCSS